MRPVAYDRVSTHEYISSKKKLLDLAFQQTELIASTESGRWKWRNSNIEKTIKKARQRKTTYPDNKFHPISSPCQ
jgi:hypothetical protein